MYEGTSTEVRVDGILTELIIVFWKQFEPSVVRPSLRVSFSRLIHPANAEPPIVVTDEGISISVRPVQL